MFRLQSCFACALLLSPIVAHGEDMAPVALNSLPKPPANVAALQVMDQKGQVIGQAMQMQTDQDGHPAALRNLFNRFLSQLHHCLATGQKYDPQRAFVLPKTRAAA